MSVETVHRRPESSGVLADITPMPSSFGVVVTLCWREIIRFVRQRNRVIGAVGQPILFWLLFGAGMHQSFRLDASAAAGQSFQVYFFPGTLVLILLFTSIFATISIIEDRREGFLQSVLVAPIPRWTMVTGKVLGGALIGLLQGLIFLLLALLLDVQVDFLTLGLIVLFLFVSAVALTALGFLLAWRMESTQGFHAIMNLLLMPMWLLSGAFFPVPRLAGDASLGQLVLHWAMRLNPLTYCVAGIRRMLSSTDVAQGLELPGSLLCWSVTIAFAMVMLAAAWRIAGTRTTGDLL